MSDRDVIAETIRSDGWTCEYHEPVSARGECTRCDDSHDRLAGKIHAALREYHTVRTVEELDALPIETVVREQESWCGFVLAKYWDQVWDEARWLYPGDDDPQTFPSLPALILYRPDEDGAL